mmetsp:Transcript_40977/g.162226  ORF Transcript_40977/g.162226 Transcript_40977/m.162226 type:complete len:806 (-) Transcript_40977:1084-3501(-)
MGAYELSAELFGHESDVRCCGVVDSGRVVTGSRDSSIILWERNKDNGRDFGPAKRFEGHEHFVNAVTVVNSTLIASGSADKTIRLWNIESGKCVLILAEHSAAVCSLKIAEDKMEIISSSWDNTARLWKLSSCEGDEITGSCTVVFRGHEAAVWDAMGCAGRIITASADKSIKLWDKANGTLLTTLAGHTDVVRNLAPAPEDGFFSVSNDGSARLWKVAGQDNYQNVNLISALHDDQFIYCASSLVSSTTEVKPLLASGGEDKNVKIVEMGSDAILKPIASIPHPGTVWAVHFMENGDVLSGCSDGRARIFTTDKERVAAEMVLSDYENSLAQQQVSTKLIGGVDVSKLPDAETALSEPGVKDGQNLIVRRGNVAEVYMWVDPASKWIKVGDVVDSPDGGGGGAAGGGAGTSGGTIDGKYYDFVFDVEVEEGGANRSLGYNRGENPYEAAQRFVEQNELSGGDYLDQIAKFIEQNVSADNRIVAAPPVARDPFTGGNRYVPGAVNTGVNHGGGAATGNNQFAPARYVPGGSNTVPRPKEEPKHIPATTYVLYTSTDQEKKIVEKLRENNDKAAKDGLNLSSEELEYLVTTTVPKVCAAKPSAADAKDAGVILKASTWSSELLVPVLDLARLAVNQPSLHEQFVSGDGSIMHVILQKVLSEENVSPAILILSCRFFCNLFGSPSGIETAKLNMSRILEQVSIARSSPNRRVRETYATLLYNYAIALKGDSRVDAVLEAAFLVFTASEKDEPVLYRILVAVGTAMSSSKEATLTAQKLGVAEAASSTASISSRLLACANEIAQLLFM